MNLYSKLNILKRSPRYFFKYLIYKYVYKRDVIPYGSIVTIKKPRICHPFIYSYFLSPGKYYNEIPPKLHKRGFNKIPWRVIEVKILGKTIFYKLENLVDTNYIYIVENYYTQLVNP